MPSTSPAGGRYGECFFGFAVFRQYMSPIIPPGGAVGYCFGFSTLNASAMLPGIVV